MRRDERGQAIVIVALAITVVLVAGGLAIDAGLLYVERRREQVAADGAAFAAAVELTKNYKAANRATGARAAALSYAATNGYNNDGVTNTVTVNIAPASGGFAGNVDYAEVIISVDVRTAFIRILGPSFATQRVQARAVGGVTGPLKPYSIVALSKTANPGVSFTGDKVKIETKDGGIMVNSGVSNAALVVTGKADIKSKERGIDVAGGTSIDPQAKIDGPVTTGAPAIPDPFAYLVPPSGAGLPTFAAVNVTSGTTTLDPGIYPSLSVGGNGKIKLNAGTYIIKGGGITLTDHGKIDDEKGGVLVYNACSDFPVASGTCGAITITDHGQIHLTDKANDTYTGVPLWQPCENTQTVSINAVDEPNENEKARIHARGAVYFPCASLLVNGDAKIELKDDNDPDLDGILVANTVSFGDKSDIKVKWKDKDKTSSVARIPALVE